MSDTPHVLFGTDEDGIGDVCDSDLDGDGIDNSNDKCPDVNDNDVFDDPDVEQEDWKDRDGDGYADGRFGKEYECDNCPGDDLSDSNPAQLDMDGDGMGDKCDPDKDGDGVYEDGAQGDDPCDSFETKNCDDNCPNVANPQQRDPDDNGAGLRCDSEEVEDLRNLQKAAQHGQIVGAMMSRDHFPQPGSNTDQPES